MDRQDDKRENYANCHVFLRILYQAQKYLTRQELKTLRGQAVNGDVTGAAKGLDKIMKQRG